MKLYEHGGIHFNTYQILMNPLEASIPQPKQMNNLLRNMEEVVSDYPLENKTYLIEFENTDYQFKAFSPLAGDELKYSVPDVKTHCHYYCFLYLFQFPETQFVTGFITVNDKRLPHSVLLYQAEGIDYIIDLTRNLFIEKSLYEKITNLEIVTILDKKTLEEDVERLNDFFLLEFGFSLRAYLFFEEEIRKELNKNSFLLNKKM